MNDFDGLTAIVTGGASGIGAATAAVLHERGANVAILDRTVATADTRYFSVPCDITDAVGVEQAVAAVAAKFGGIDILINNAGIGAAGDITANDDAEWHRVLNVNVVGIARVSRAALPPPATVQARGNREHLLGRRDSWPAKPCALLGKQGSRRRSHARDGRRPRARKHSRERGDAWHRRHPMGRPFA